eukprot:Nk52_evm17s280 gene=Nk52_evmTU17s280
MSRDQSESSSGVRSGLIVKEQWRIEEKLGSGAFGEIHRAKDLKTKTRVAIKIENCENHNQVLKMEVAVLRKLQGNKHICKYEACGRNERFSYVVMQLLGKNLSELRKKQPETKFSHITCSLLGLQMLSAIEHIHRNGYLHRDIKPSNFVMGQEKDSRVCYLVDFGLCRNYRTEEGNHREPRSVAGFRGTARYASLNAHKSKELSRRDDMWSFFYMMVEFFVGQLPWRRLKDKKDVGKCKMGTKTKELIKDAPPEFAELAEHVEGLGYYDEPNYEFAKGLFMAILARANGAMDSVFDWERPLQVSRLSKVSATSSSKLASSTKSAIGSVIDVQLGLRDSKKEVGSDTPQSRANVSSCLAERLYSKDSAKIAANDIKSGEWAKAKDKKPKISEKEQPKGSTDSENEPSFSRFANASRRKSFSGARAPGEGMNISLSSCVGSVGGKDVSEVNASIEEWPLDVGIPLLKSTKTPSAVVLVGGKQTAAVSSAMSRSSEIVSSGIDTSIDHNGYLWKAKHEDKKGYARLDSDHSEFSSFQKPLLDPREKLAFERGSLDSLDLTHESKRSQSNKGEEAKYTKRDAYEPEENRKQKLNVERQDHRSHVSTTTSANHISSQDSGFDVLFPRPQKPIAAPDRHTHKANRARYRRYHRNTNFKP